MMLKAATYSPIAPECSITPGRADTIKMIWPTSAMRIAIQIVLNRLSSVVNLQPLAHVVDSPV